MNTLPPPPHTQLFCYIVTVMSQSSLPLIWGQCNAYCYCWGSKRISFANCGCNCHQQPLQVIWLFGASHPQYAKLTRLLHMEGEILNYLIFSVLFFFGWTSLLAHLLFRTSGTTSKNDVKPPDVESEGGESTHIGIKHFNFPSALSVADII